MARSTHPDDNRHKKRRGPRTDAEAMASKPASHNPSATTSASTTLPGHDKHDDSDAPRLRLLELPSELLLQTALQLCGTKAIFSLSLVNKYLHGVAQEAIGKKLVIPTNRILDALKMLARVPELIPKVNTLELGDYQPPHDDRCLCLRDADFDNHATAILSAAITWKTQGIVGWDDIQVMKHVSGRVWPATHIFPLDLLVSICPNIKEVTIELPRKSDFDKTPTRISSSSLIQDFPIVNSEYMPVIPFDGVAHIFLRSKLEALTIPEVSRWKGMPQLEVINIPDDMKWREAGKFIITLPGFTRLKYLDVPMDILGLPQSIVFQNEEDIKTVEVNMVHREGAARNTAGNTDDTSQREQASKLVLPAKTLPLSLTSLRLRGCTDRTFAFLDVVREIPSDQLKLKHIDLFFEFTARSSILQCYLMDDGSLDYLVLLSELERMGVIVTFHFGSKEKVFDIRNELMPLYFLSPAEAGLMTLLKKQFAVLNQCAAMRRWSQPEARHLFVRHALHHFDLLNSPTFDATFWKDVTFFHGPTIKWTPDSQPRKINASNKTKLEPKRRRRALLGKSIGTCSTIYPIPLERS